MWSASGTLCCEKVELFKRPTSPLRLPGEIRFGEEFQIGCRIEAGSRTTVNLYFGVSRFEFVTLSAAARPLASVTASAFAQKCMKYNRGSSSSM